MKRGLAALSFLAGTLAGCAMLDPAPAPVAVAIPAERAPSSAEELVAYLARLRTLDEPALILEISRQREFARQAPNGLNRVKLGLALAAAPQADDADLLAVVESVARDSTPSDVDVQAMASFLQHLAVERRRLKEGAAAAGARSRDDRKAYESQRQRADTLQERNAQLQQKLDALTNLEKSLSGRRGN
jgi:hypothetical protein